MEKMLRNFWILVHCMIWWKGYPKQFGSNWRTWIMNLMGLLWKNHLCLVSYLFYSTNSRMEVIMKSLASHKALAQIILYNHRIQGRSRESSAECINYATQINFLLYKGLKVFSTTRSSEIINILHAHGLCVSCDRILRMTKGLGEALLQLFRDNNSGLLWTGLFTVGTKDNIEKNARCTISKSHYHGTSMSLF